MFTDDTLAPKTRTTAAHILELRTAISALRQMANLSPAVFTDPVLSGGGPIRGVHLVELNQAAIEACQALEIQGPAAIAVVPHVTLIRRAEVLALREAVK